MDLALAGRMDSGNDTLVVYTDLEATRSATAGTPGSVPAPLPGHFDNDRDLDIIVTGYTSFRHHQRPADKHTPSLGNPAPALRLILTLRLENRFHPFYLA